MQYPSATVIIPAKDFTSVTLAEVKKDLRLFGDKSRDDEVQELIHAAHTWIEKQINRPLEVSSITDYYKRISDYYKRISDYMLLSDKLDSGVTLEVKYFDKDNAEQTFADSNYIVDKTLGSKHALSLTTAGKQTASGIEYSKVHANPVFIEYSTSEIDNEQGDMLKVAIRKKVLSLWGDLDGIEKELAKHDAMQALALLKRNFI